MSTLSIAAPTESHGFMAKAGALAAGTALAGAALFGGVTVAPTVAAGLAGSVQHDYVLTADPFPTFEQSLQSLLDTLGYGNMGQVLGLFGTEANPINTSSDLSTLLAALNPDGTSLDTITGGLLSADLTAVLNDVQVGGVGLGDVPIDTLLGGFIGGDGANTSIGDLLGLFGLGQYAGLLDLPFLGLSPSDTLASVLNEMLGIGATTSLNDLLTDNGLGDATIASLLGIDPSAPWNEVISGITLGGTLSDPDGTGTLGGETLGALLTSLLPTGSDPVTDTTTLTDFLGDLGIFSMLGLG